MFKILAISALFLVLACDAANLSCKSATDIAVAGTCPDGNVLVNGGQYCCEKDAVYDADAHACRSEPMPSLGGFCPDGFIVVADEGCCAVSDTYAKQK